MNKPSGVETDADRRLSFLRTVKIVHTLIWLFFVGCIGAIPLFTAISRFRLAALFVAIVGVEVAILMLNRMT